MKNLKEFLNESIVSEANIHDEELELKKDYEWCQAFEIGDLEAEGLIDSKDVDELMKMKKGRVIVIPKGSTLVAGRDDSFYQFYTVTPGNVYIPILKDELRDLIKHCK